MLTGQRVEEIAGLHVDQWDAKERIIDWSKTKNGLAACHSSTRSCGRAHRVHRSKRARLVFPVRERPDPLRKREHAVQLYVAPARAGRHSRSSPTAIFGARGRRSPAKPESERNPRPHPKPRAPGREFEELRSLDLHARETRRHEQVGQVRLRPASRFAAHGRRIGVSLPPPISGRTKKEQIYMILGTFYVTLGRNAMWTPTWPAILGMAVSRETRYRTHVFAFSAQGEGLFGGCRALERGLKAACQEVRGASADLQMPSARPSWSRAWLQARFLRLRDLDRVALEAARRARVHVRRSLHRKSAAESQRKRLLRVGDNSGQS